MPAGAKNHDAPRPVTDGFNYAYFGTSVAFGSMSDSTSAPFNDPLAGGTASSSAKKTSSSERHPSRPPTTRAASFGSKARATFRAGPGQRQCGSPRRQYRLGVSDDPAGSVQQLQRHVFHELLLRVECRIGRLEPGRLRRPPFHRPLRLRAPPGGLAVLGRSVRLLRLESGGPLSASTGHRSKTRPRARPPTSQRAATRS